MPQVEPTLLPAEIGQIHSPGGHSTGRIHLHISKEECAFVMFYSNRPSFTGAPTYTSTLDQFALRSVSTPPANLPNSRDNFLERAWAFLLKTDKDDRPTQPTICHTKAFLLEAYRARLSIGLQHIDSISAFSGSIMIRWLNGTATATLTVRPLGKGTPSLYWSPTAGSGPADSNLIKDATPDDLAKRLDSFRTSSTLASGRRFRRLFSRVRQS